MAKQAADHFTLDLLDKPKRGRPRKPDAMTDAERARRYRAKKRGHIPVWEMNLTPPPGYKFKYFCKDCGWTCTRACIEADIAAFVAAADPVHWPKPQQANPTVTADGWYFPGSAEWHAQRALLGKTPPEVKP